MNDRLALMIGLLLIFPFTYAATTRTCTDSDTLQITTNKTITIDGEVDEMQIVESIDCPDGCANGECKPTRINITVPIYIFMAGFGVFLMVMSFFQSDILIFKWLSFIILLMLGASSFNINRDFCEYTTSGWSCYIQQYKMVNLAYLWFGLAAMMFVYAFYSSVVKPAEMVIDETKRASR